MFCGFSLMFGDLVYFAKLPFIFVDLLVFDDVCGFAWIPR